MGADFCCPCAALSGHFFCLWYHGFIFMLVLKQQLHWFEWQNSQLQLKWQNFMLWQNFRKKILWKGKMCVIFERVRAVWSHSRWSVLLVEWAGTNLKEFFLFFLNWFFANCTVFFKANQEYLTKWLCQGKEGFLKHNCSKTKMNNPCCMNNQLKWDFLKGCFGQIAQLEMWNLKFLVLAFAGIELILVAGAELFWI